LLILRGVRRMTTRQEFTDLAECRPARRIAWGPTPPAAVVASSSSSSSSSSRYGHIKTYRLAAAEEDKTMIKEWCNGGRHWEEVRSRVARRRCDTCHNEFCDACLFECGGSMGPKCKDACTIRTCHRCALIHAAVNPKNCLSPRISWHCPKHLLPSLPRRVLMTRIV
jgi:hypothetical protein